MPEPPRIVPVACPFGQGSVVYVYYVDAPEPALIDTGVAASPAGVLEPALAAAGFRLDDVRWILATHGHYDHLGAAHALKRRLPAARVGVHADDHFLMRHRAAHLDGYAGVRARFLDDPAVLAQTDALLLECISGEMAADRELREGDHVNLGGDLTFTVVHTPGHSRGSSSFVLDGPGWAFTGDAVQVHGSSSSRFPLYEDPVAYRASVDRLLNDVRPGRLFLGHRFTDPARGQVLEAQLEGESATAALRASLEIEAHIAAAAAQIAPPLESAASFAPAARVLGYDPGQPASWPVSFFATLSGYVP